MDAILASVDFTAAAASVTLLLIAGIGITLAFKGSDLSRKAIRKAG